LKTSCLRTSTNFVNESKLTKQRKATRFNFLKASLPFQRLHQSTSKCWADCNLLIQLKALQKSNEIGANAVQRRQKFVKLHLKKLPPRSFCRKSN
jgi:hypothetical protein